jgi:hypothetical protein
MTSGRAAALGLVLGIGPVACGQLAGEPGGAGAAESGRAAAAAPGDGEPVTAGPSPVTQQELPLLAQGELRVPLFVVPGDALVEVDGQPVRRRNGVVELTGKAGDVRRVRARKGDKSTEDRLVTIKETGASPSLVDLNEPQPAAAGTVKAAPKALDFGD